MLTTSFLFNYFWGPIFSFLLALRSTLFHFPFSFLLSIFGHKKPQDMSLRQKKHRKATGIDLRLFNPLKKGFLLSRHWSNRSCIFSYSRCICFHHLHHSVRPPFFIFVYKGKYIHIHHLCKPFLLNFLNSLLI